MPYQPTVFDYESVGPSGRTPHSPEAAADWSSPESVDKPETPSFALPAFRRASQPTIVPLAEQENWWSARRGHVISYCGLFLFTAILFFRPYEYIEALASFSSLAFWPAMFTLAVFFPTQVALEGTLTARPREVNLALLICAAALISMPLAINPGEAWAHFNEILIKAVLMFIVIVNAVRTKKRLTGMLLLALAVSVALSINAVNDYRLGNLAVEGYRVKGSIGGMFGNPNDMALHLVTMIPIAVGLFFGTRGAVKKAALITCVMFFVTAIVVTFSRGGFLGLACITAFLGWKIGRRQRLAVILLLVLGGGAFLALAPGEYANRLSTIANTDLDPNGSAGARQRLLIRSIYVTLANPIFGVGIGNFHTVSIREQVSHNAYTQVSAEMGVAAMIIYVMFIVVPLKRLRQIERETASSIRSNSGGGTAAADCSRFYYLAIALQASLVGYMVCSFFASVADHWYIYYLVGYAVVLRRLYVIHQRKLIEAGGAASGQPVGEASPSNSLFGKAEEAEGRS